MYLWEEEKLHAFVYVWGVVINVTIADGFEKRIQMMNCRDGNAI